MSKNKKLTIAENCLKYGVGAFNIDATRVGDSGAETHSKTEKIYNAYGKYGSLETVVHNYGRFPANLILGHTSDCEFLGVTEDTRSGGERTTTCHSGKEPKSGGEGTGGTMKETSSIPKYSCSPDCPCRLIDEQAPNAGAIAVVPEKERTNKKTNCYGKYESRGNKDQKLDGLGGASRFFLQILEDEVE